MSEQMVRLCVRIQLVFVLGLQEDAVVRVEHRLHQICEELFEQTTRIHSLLRLPTLIQKDHVNALLQILYLSQTVVPVFPNSGTADFDRVLFV